MIHNIFNLKWAGHYGPPYVNILHRTVGNHLRGPFLFHCCTENPEGLDPEIQVIRFPAGPSLKLGWPDVLAKLLITANGFGDLQGPSLFRDLDVVIMDDMDQVFGYKPGANCMFQNWVGGMRSRTGKRPPVGNSSVFRYEAGASGYVYGTFLREMHIVENQMFFNATQTFFTHTIKEVHWLPEKWGRSYKCHCRPLFLLKLIPTSRRIPDIGFPRLPGSRRSHPRVPWPQTPPPHEPRTLNRQFLETLNALPLERAAQGRRTRVSFPTPCAPTPKFTRFSPSLPL